MRLIQEHQNRLLEDRSQAGRQIRGRAQLLGEARHARQSTELVGQVGSEINKGIRDRFLTFNNDRGYCSALHEGQADFGLADTRETLDPGDRWSIV